MKKLHSLILRKIGLRFGLLSLLSIIICGNVQAASDDLACKLNKVIQEDNYFLISSVRLINKSDKLITSWNVRIVFNNPVIVKNAFQAKTINGRGNAVVFTGKDKAEKIPAGGAVHFNFEGTMEKKFGEPECIVLDYSTDETATPTNRPGATPTNRPGATPTNRPGATPTNRPGATPTNRPGATPTNRPSATPTNRPTATPTNRPSATPTNRPSATPTNRPSATPTNRPTATPTNRPTATPTQRPTATPGAGVATELPETYTTLSCSICHGDNGQGATKLMGYSKTFEQMQTTIRGGVPGKMSAFTTAQLSDMDIARIYSYFSGQPIPATSTPTPPPAAGVDVGQNVPALKMVTRTQWKNTMDDVFGYKLSADDEIQVFSVAASWADHGSGVYQLQELESKKLSDFIRGAEKVSAYAAASAANISKAAPDCVGGTVRRTCVASFINKTGKRLFRRPVDPEQVTSLLTMYDQIAASTSATEAFKAVVLRMLVNPKFIYHDITGGNRIAVHPNNSSLIELDAYEKCAKLAEVILDSVPDNACLALADTAATSNKTLTQLQVNSEASRLLLTPRGQDHLPKYLRLISGIEQTTPNRVSGFPDEQVAAAQWPALKTQFDNFVKQQVLKPVGVSGFEIFLQSSTDPANVTQTINLDGEYYRGVFGLPAFIRTSYNSVFKGLDMLRQLIGQDIASPPSSVFEMRDIDASQRTVNADCSGCHLQMDPLGFQVMRNFAADGKLMNASSRELITNRAPMTLSEGILQLRDRQGQLLTAEFSSLKELSEKLAASDEVKCNFVKKYFAAHERRSAGTADGSSWKSMCTEFVDQGSDFNKLPLSYVKTPAFNYLKAE